MLQGLRRTIGRYAAPRAKETDLSALQEDKPEDMTPYEAAAWSFTRQDRNLRLLETEICQLLHQFKVASTTMATVAEVFSDTCSEDADRCVGGEYKEAARRIERDVGERLEQSVRFTVLDPLRDRLGRHSVLQEQINARDVLATECKTLWTLVQRLPTLRLEDDDKRAQTYSRLDRVIGELKEVEQKLLPLLEDAIQSDSTSSTENLFNTMRLQTAIFFAHSNQLLMESFSPAEKEVIAESSQALKTLGCVTHLSTGSSLSRIASKLSKVSSSTSDGWTDVEGSNSSTTPDATDVLEGSEEDEEIDSSSITLEDFGAGRAPLLQCKTAEDDIKIRSMTSTSDSSDLLALASYPVVPPDDEDYQEWSNVVPPRRSTSPSPTGSSYSFGRITPRRSASMLSTIRKSIRGKFNYSNGEARIIRQSSAPLDTDISPTASNSDDGSAHKTEYQPCKAPQTLAEWQAIEACLWEIDVRVLRSPSKPFLAADPASGDSDDLLSRLLREHESLCFECLSFLHVEDLARLSKANYTLHSHLIDCVPAWKKCIRSGGLSDSMRSSMWLSVFYEPTPWRSNGIASHHLSAERRRNMYDQLLAKVGAKLTESRVAESSPLDEDAQLLVWIREIDVDVVRTCHRSVYAKRMKPSRGVRTITTAMSYSSSRSHNTNDDSVRTILNEIVDHIAKTESEGTTPDLHTNAEISKRRDSDLEAKIRRVLRAYVVYNPRVGYCQGMGFLVRLLAEVAEDEADIFWLFVGFSEPENDRNLYEPGMAVLQPFLSKFELLFSTHMPELYAHFQIEGVHVATFCTRWFLTFFSSFETLSPALVIRLLDIFIVDGWRIMFSVSLVILDELRDQLLRCDLEGILRVLQFPRSYMPEPDDLRQRQLIRHALAFSISRSINSI